MERTYNTFVDNGLFVLAYYLEKNIDEVTIEDILNSVDLMEKEIKNTLSCEKYSSMAFSSFQNSQYTQAKKKVKEQFQLILSNLGDEEYCSVCGKKHIKGHEDLKYKKALSRCLSPTLSTNTFFNYSNNLKQLNICPICIYLSMLSFLNTRPLIGLCLLMNSDDDEFMYYITKKIYEEREQNIRLNAKKDKANKEINVYKLKKEFIKDIIFNENIYDGYIEATIYLNTAQNESMQQELLTKRDIEFLRMLNKKSLLSQFDEKGLFFYILNGHLRNDYLSCVFNKDGLKVSMELFQLIEEEYNKVGKNIIELIKRICKKVFESTETKEIADLKMIQTQSDFEELLVKWRGSIDNLMTLEEFEMLTDYKNYRRNKNRMLIEFYELNNTLENN
ncbi:hypothetical protein AB8J26_001442 [Clostridium perfringens]|nr:hypothetical protein [Clostridium perfringens]ELC8347339.1 hypothetical protein [Clostridium perfringens]ELC8410200.1 hypothetical protein [Clostridium perfringens]ELC8439893.1 hypothetical protein [Clostridium perfringens]